VYLVTGATGAIGQAIARQLAETGHRVVITSRDAERGRNAAREIQRATGHAVQCEAVDVSRRESVEAFRARWEGPLHALVNNAAQSPRQRTETPEGIETQFATNVLGYFWMITAFEDLLRASAPARVVNVASYWAGDLDLDDLEFKSRPYDNDMAYRQSKQAVRMLTAAFARRLEGAGVTVNSCHPGDVDSKLSRDLGYGGSETPDEGADTPVWLATSPDVAEVTGRYFAARRAETDRFVRHAAAVERLYAICAGYGA
jgi:NAD(P)-dependent dehydrogenase (short-subunit alcohol dehydrogenase family)